MKRRVALVAPAGASRTALAEYLRNAGFDVDECTQLAAPAGYGALVVIDDRLVPGLIKATRHQRIVVVSSKPTALKDVAAGAGERLRILPAPAFGWDVVDTLRAAR